MKIAVTGKGGVGKTTIAGTMARILAARGKRVYAVDADPDANLAAAVGLDADTARGITPIADMGGLIEERTGAAPGSSAPVFKMNPQVDDIPERLSVEGYGVHLLQLGTVKKGGSGCICPESALLRTLLTHLILSQDDVVIVDMEAGIEHLGRATARGVDAMLVVVEPGRRSVHTAEAISKLAADIGIDEILLIVNKVTEADSYLCEELAKDFKVIGCLPFSEDVRRADLEEKAPYDVSETYRNQVEDILDQLIASMK